MSLNRKNTRRSKRVAQSVRSSLKSDCVYNGQARKLVRGFKHSQTRIDRLNAKQEIKEQLEDL